MTGRSAARSVVAAALVSVLGACARGPSPWQGATPTTWPLLRSALAAERAGRQQFPWAATVSTLLREPRSGRVIHGRGGLALAPHQALRLVLLGPAGLTMLDAWITPHRWRVAVPPIGLVRRGGDDNPSDLPIAFLRGWFFRPLEGALFAATFEPEGPAWLLRDGKSVLEVRSRRCARGERLLMTRREGAHAESVDECRAGAAPQPGDQVVYEDAVTRLRVELAVESVSSEPPDAEAFSDPDVGGAP